MFLAIPGMTLANAPYACACSCAPSSRVENFLSADAVFHGTVLTHIYHGDPKESWDADVEWIFDVESTLKGEVPDPVSVWSSAGSGTCGVWFQDGGRYEVYTRIGEGKHWTGLCSGNRKLETPADGSTPIPPPSPSASPSVQASQSPPGPVTPSPAPSPKVPSPSEPGPSISTTPETSQGPPHAAEASQEPAIFASRPVDPDQRGHPLLFLAAALLSAVVGLGVWWRAIRRG